MSTTQTSLELRVSRVIKARRSLVFAAWTQPELMRRWLAPGTMHVAEASADARVGGAYRIAMAGAGCSGPEGNAVANGTYTAVVPNERIEFTWVIGNNPAAETLVTVDLRDVAGGTEVVITHRGFNSAELRDRHEHGWTGCLDNLEVFAGQSMQVPA
ncbi:MAG: SRPBCC family protein [Terriglobales bacterium]